MKENLSTKFILPMLGIRWRDFEGLENCFIGDALKGKEFTNNIFLLFDSRNNRFEKIHDDCINSNLYVTHYAYDEYMMYVFNLPDDENTQINYDLFKQGEYSRFTNTYKNHVIKFYSGKIQNHNILKSEEYQNIKDNVMYYNRYIKDVLERGEYLRNKINIMLDVDLPPYYELCSPPDNKNEVFNDEHLKELFNVNNETQTWI